MELSKKPALPSRVGGAAAISHISITILPVLIGLLLTTPASAGGCGIFGGNVCNPGCPDECSPILCPGNALCKSSCGGSPCNVGCSPGPCGSGCPDRCNLVLCPQNACSCNSCTIGCSPGPCGSGCSDQCSLVICPQNHCTAACTAQPQCDVLCGGDICGSGCPDECSLALCPQNHCTATCTSQPDCDILCGGDICGSGCPDECSAVLCPGNALCETGCGGDPCNIGCICHPDCPLTACDLLCGGDPCNADCPDECSPILCPGNPCSGQTPCGGAGERGCCVFEAVPSCDSGLVEDAPCTNENCGFLDCSLGTCVDPNCGSEGERACCFGEEASVVGHTCAAGLIEIIGCSGDCECTGLTAIGSSTGTCVDSPCGAKGQRACCVDDPGGAGSGLFGVGCQSGLVEKGACLGILGAGHCGPGLIPCSIGVCVEITDCGAEGQRACCFLEDISIGACESGLIENGSCDEDLGVTNCFCGGVSVVRSSGVCRQPDCGGPGERGCCLLERIPSCDPGLIEDLTPGCANDAPPGGCDCGFGPGESLGVCRALKGLGETHCDNVFDPCASGLLCLATDTGTICVPEAGDGLFADDVCAAFYNPLVHQGALNSGITLSFGTGASASAGITGSVEVGVAYGADGCYGCYFTHCIGVEIDIAIGLAACTGQGFDGLFSSVEGDSCVATVSAEFPFIEVGGSVSSEWDGSGVVDCFSAPEPDASSACFSVGLGLNPLPIGGALELCNTVTNLVACTDDKVSADGDLILAPNELPTCIDGLTFVACPGKSIDLIPIALDPDGDELTYQWSTDCPDGTFDDDTLASPTLSLVPAPSCSSLDCSLTVTADGVDDADDPVNVMCAASVTNDTSAPEFTAFPSDLKIASDETTDPSSTGLATAVDFCDSAPSVSFSDSVATGVCPQEQIITRTWTASDACGNSNNREQIITVSGAPGDFDGDADADLIDYGSLKDCLSGPTGVLKKGCTCLDTNGDNHVDLLDVRAFQINFTGADN